MNLKTSTASIATAQPHCRHRTPSGRRCRLVISDPDSGLCFKHAVHKKKDRDLADLAAALTGRSEDFQTAQGINHSLAELYKLLAEDKIAPRRAAVLAYISNLLLRTLPAMERELDPELRTDSGAPCQLIIDVPRPDRE